jgi:choline dehydrogenase-like flavoprotein
MTTFDYIVVGGGSAGCVLAARLSEDPTTRVLLLEAGGGDRGLEIAIPAAWPKLFKSAVDWDYATEPQAALAGRSLYWPRGKTLGGTSSLNAQMYVRGHRSDFDHWAELGNPGWGYEDVLPYFRRSEDNERGSSAHHGAGGALRVSDLREVNPLTRAFLRAAIEAGVPPTPDFNGAEQAGVGLTQVTQREGRRDSTATAFLRPARRRANLTIATNTHATRVLFEGRRAVGVAYRQGDRQRIARASCEVVVCAGTVGSPHLLLLSGIGPAAQLRSHGVDVVCDLPGVGHNLQDHHGVPLLATARRRLSLLGADSPLNLLRWLVKHRGRLASNVCEAAAFVRSRPEAPAPDLELLFAPVLFIDEGLTAPTAHGLSLAPIVLRPRGRGSIALRSPDPLAPPAIQPNALSDPEDLRLLAEGVMHARRVLEAPALAQEIDRIVGPAADEDVGTFIRKHAHAMFHAAGTCKMGVDELAVLDPELRVRGVDGLRVADASVMPTIVGGHPCAAVVMIAERCADLVRGAQRRTATPASASRALTSEIV